MSLANEDTFSSEWMQTSIRRPEFCAEFVIVLLVLAMYLVEGS